MLKKSSVQGFTLIEVVVVLTVLGILAAIAGAKYFDLQEQARIHAAEAFVAEVQSRINAEFAAGLLEGESCEDARQGIVDELFPGAMHSDGHWIVRVNGNSSSESAFVCNSKWGWWCHAFSEGALHFPVCSSSGS